MSGEGPAESTASDPGGIPLSRRALAAFPTDDGILARLIRRFVGDEFTRIFAEKLRLGDARAAVVASVEPPLVAAYTDELDAVLLLRFPAGFLERRGLRQGDRLLTVNTYGNLPEFAPDLIAGPGDYGRWQNFHPLIADFLTDDAAALARAKARIAEPEWRRCADLAAAYRRARPGVARDGSPYEAYKPATPAPR